MPELAVLIPVRNARQWIEEALLSVLSQDVRDLEVVVVDDGSNDGTTDRIEAVGDRRVRVISSAGVGVASALRTGLTHVSTPYVARMDADDVMMPGRLSRQLGRMRSRPSLALVGGQLQGISGTGRPYPALNPRLPLATLSCRIQLGFSNSFAHPTVLFRRSAVEAVGGYHSDFVFEDYELWLRLARKFEVENMEHRLIKYRWHTGNTYVRRRAEGAAQLAARIVAHNREVLDLDVTERAIKVLLAPRETQPDDSLARSEARAHLRAVVHLADRAGIPEADRRTIRHAAARLAAQLALRELPRRPGALLLAPRGIYALPRLGAVAAARRLIP